MKLQFSEENLQLTYMAATLRLALDAGINIPLDKAIEVKLFNSTVVFSLEKEENPLRDLPGVTALRGNEQIVTVINRYVSGELHSTLRFSWKSGTSMFTRVPHDREAAVLPAGLPTILAEALKYCRDTPTERDISYYSGNF